MVSFDNIIDKTINEKVIALHQAFAKRFFPGLIETVPAYSSLAVFYDTDVIKKNNPKIKSVFGFVKAFTEQVISGMDDVMIQNDECIISVPVYYNGDDLGAVAASNGITTAELVNIHTEKIYLVFMIGFQPGFAYMGEVDKRIATPRLASPRSKVPAGSVGIAGSQTGIYPFASPGGWKLIGQTPIKIFDVKKSEPCLFKPGDRVKFVSISKTVFKKINEY